MDFDLTEDQREIKNVARELLTARSPWAKVREAADARAYGDALWRELAELGWPGIAVAEEHGGQGLGAGARAQQLAGGALDVALVVGEAEVHYAAAFSRGRPSTRSATMFLSTSVVPPSIELPRERSSS